MNWEPWSGCYPYSDGCSYCYYYGPYSKRHGQNTIVKTRDFSKPLNKTAQGNWKIPAGKTVVTCFATDFWLPEADEWRQEAWKIIKERSDLDFLILTKRIERFPVSLPEDWGEGYSNVFIGCTVENQTAADLRLPLFLDFPILRRYIACAPLLGRINLRPYLSGIQHVTVGGETSQKARVCDYDWVLDLCQQCQNAQVTFWFKNTGTNFRKDGIVRRINAYQQTIVAKELAINNLPKERLF